MDPVNQPLIEAPPDDELRCPLLLPTGRDAELVQECCRRHGIRAVVCATLAALAEVMESGCGPAVVAEEALRPADWEALWGVFEGGPDWSELPLIVLSWPNATSCSGEQRLAQRRGTTVLARPTRETTLIGVIQAGLESRRRQYQVRNLVIELREANRNLDARAQQLQRLALALSQAEEAERRQVAKSLHDGLQQLLAAARVSLRALRPKDGEDPARQEAVQSVDSILSEAIESSRTLSHELSPPILYQSGLGPALEQLAENTSKKYAMDVSVISDESGGDISETMRAFLFEAARELLYNVHVHSGSDSATVRLASWDEVVQLSVSDQGKGFDSERIAGGDAEVSGMGLFGIRERVEFFGGRFAVQNTPGEGACIALTVPKTVAGAKDGGASESATGPAESETAPDGGVDERPLRVLIVDDHRVMRQGLVSLLDDVGGIEVVGEAGDGQSALCQSRALDPDVVVLDVSLPDIGGVDVARRLRRDQPQIRVIGLSMFEESRVSEEMLEAGAEAYLVKSGPTESLVSSILACRPLSAGQGRSGPQ